MIARLLPLLAGNREADAAVPPSGATGHLTFLASAGAAFLCVLALAGALAAGRLAERWSGGLAVLATVELPAGPRQAADLARVREILAETPGVREERLLSEAEIRALLVPWIGATDRLGAEDLPLLLSVAEAPELAPEGLRLRLAGEVPEARYHRHAEAAGTLGQSARTGRALAWVAAIAGLGVLLAAVALAVRASLAIHADVVVTLRQLGARDAYIARAFVRRFTLRALAGAAVGAGVAMAAVALAADRAGLGDLAPGPEGWLVLASVPLVAAVLAFAVTRGAALKAIRRVR